MLSTRAVQQACIAVWSGPVARTPALRLLSAAALRSQLAAPRRSPSSTCSETTVGHVFTRHASSSSASSSSGSGVAGLTSVKAAQSAAFHTLPTTSVCILAHIDAGKSTLADRLLEMTGTISRVNAEDPKGINRQVLDTLQVEKQRGITVKSQAVSMLYDSQGSSPGKRWLINLIDTPGHVDFSYEVSRSLSAAQSVLLLVDATQGVQAQTISVFRFASAQKNPKLSIIPIINKVDLPAADVSKCVRQMRTMLGLDVRDPSDPAEQGGKMTPILISAKTGENVEEVLEAIVAHAPAGALRQAEQAPIDKTTPLRALVFDSWYDQFKGVVVLAAIRQGSIKRGDRVVSAITGKSYEVLLLGINHPGPVEVPMLREGQVGWIICNMRNISDAKIGDVLRLASEKSISSTAAAETLADKELQEAAFKALTPMVYAGIYPSDSTEFGKLEESINKLALNDRSVAVARESSMALGQGCRCGFLGTLHLDVFRQRLRDEHQHEILVTAPTVTYRIRYKPGKAPVAAGKGAVELTEDENGEFYRLCSNPVDFPEDHERKMTIESIEEPMVKGKLQCPQDYVGEMMTLCAEYRGVQLDYDLEHVGLQESASSSGAVAGDEQFAAELVYRLPLAEIVNDFYDKLKSRSSGFASFEYEADGYEPSDLVKVSFLVSGTPVDALSTICHRSKALQIGKSWAAKLKTSIPRQQFEVAVQAMAGGKVIARESLSAYRKDVTAGLYGGGDMSRLTKHRKKQKAGKKRLKAMSFGRVQIPQEAFAQVLDRR